MKKIIVSKFGGSSMADLNAMELASNICLKFKSNIIIVSATYGTTNQLISLVNKAPDGKWDFCAQTLKDISHRHLSLAKELNSNEHTIKNIEHELYKLSTLVRGIYLLKDCTAKAYDSIVSCGEILSSLLFSDFLNTKLDKKVEYFDIGSVLKTDDHFSKAKPLLEIIKKEAKVFFKPIVNEEKIFVTQGFIGQTIDGKTTTLGRGGSDYSAALIAESIDADLLQIWTDVAGIATTDPRICPNATPISELSFEEAGELAIFGAKILHPTTILPAQRKSIDVFVGSTFEPDKPGTWIRKSCDHTPLIRAIALRNNQTILTLATPKMLDAHGFLAKIFNVFDKYEISIDLVTTSEIALSISVDQSMFLNKKLVAELKNLATLKLEENLTSISLIGNNINHTPNLASQIFSELSIEKSINIRMICMGASHHHFCVLVNSNDGIEAVKRLHAKFLQQRI